jgi:hypothetical protein
MFVPVEQPWIPQTGDPTADGLEGNDDEWGHPTTKREWEVTNFLFPILLSFVFGVAKPEYGRPYPALLERDTGWIT